MMRAQSASIRPFAWLVATAVLTTISTGVFATQTERTAIEHFRKGMQSLLSERYEQAERSFRAAVEIDPLYDAAFYGLGQVYMATKRYPQAVEAYVDSRNAFKAAVSAEMSGALNAEKRVRDQIQAIQDEITRLERMSSSASPGAQQAIMRNRDLKRQLESRLNRSMAMGPAPIPAGLSMALGSAYFRSGDLEAAEREYVEAIKTEPKFGEAHSNLAVIYMMTNRIYQAEEEVALAEKSGFKVSTQFKEDLRKRQTKQ